MAKRYQVFVSSTYTDLQHERQKVIQALMKMDCIPAGMELFPAADEEQWAFIRRVIDDCDYYILIIGGRYGSISADGISYTEKEYDYAVSIGLKVLVFLHKEPDQIPVGKSEMDPALREKLEQFRRKVGKSRLVEWWTHQRELAGLVALSLLQTIKISPAVGWVRADKIAADDLLQEINNLRKENGQLKDQIVDLQYQVSLDNLDLAPLTKPIEVGLEWTASSNGQRKKIKEKTVTTWEEIFSHISPSLQTNLNEETAKTKIGTFLYRKYCQGTATIAYLDQDNLETIRIQFQCLGLIEISNLQTVNGTMGLFWQLSAKGVQLMIELRVVKADAA